MGFITQLNGIDFGSLGLLARILLITDGTLTDIVEAAFLEPIELVKLDAAIAPAARAIEPLDVRAGDPVLCRRILLRGENTGTTYVHAESLIAIDALDAEFRDELLAGDQPMGRLWVQHQLETRKEILEIRRRCAGELAPHFGLPADAPLLSRSYRVISAERPIMHITESFPALMKL